MKNFFLILFALIVMAIQANAQWFLGGDIGLNVSNLKENREYELSEENLNINNTEVGFNITPRFCYYFNTKFAIGMSVSAGANFRINEINNTKYQTFSFNWGAFPFVRYSVFTYKKFSVILQGSTGAGGYQEFWKLDNLISENAFNRIAIRVINITPLLGFNLTDRLQMEAGLNFLSLGYHIDIASGVAYDSSKVDYTKHDFNIGFKSSSVLSLSQLHFGVLYKF